MYQIASKFLGYLIVLKTSLGLLHKLFYNNSIFLSLFLLSFMFWVERDIKRVHKYVFIHFFLMGVGYGRQMELNLGE